MSEHSSINDARLHAKAKRIANRLRDDYMKTLLSAMRPSQLSPADVQVLEDYINKTLREDSENEA